jgi:colanic acid biosynthesis protein WcaH
VDDGVPGRLADDEFARLIRIAPLVAIDIVVISRKGQVLLALRRKEPAKNCYFVPGGRILKNETISSAFERIARSETGLDAQFEAARLIGVYDHIYSTNLHEVAGYGTHYVVLAHELILKEDVKIKLDEHHATYKWVDVDALIAMSDVHPYVKAYFRK